MKRPQSGYTIIEVMIFLLVSAALLTSVMAMISGRQERTRFTQSVNSVDQKLQDILNDVSTGYYPTTGNFGCGSVGDIVTFSGSATEQGANTGCVFLGKAIWLGSSSRTNYDVYTLVGARSATDLSNAGTKLLGVGTNPGIVDKYNALADVEIIKTASLTDPSRNVTGIALISNFSQTSALTNEVTGNAARVDLYEVLGDFESNAGKTTMQPATNGVILCLQQGGLFGRKAAIKMGAPGGRQLGSEVIIDGWPGECS